MDRPADAPLARLLRRTSLLLSLIAASSAHAVEAQLSRGSIVQPVADTRRGDVFFGIGVRHETNARFPVAGLTGDLTSYADLRFALGVGERALFEVRGPVRQVLAIDTRGSAAVTLRPDVADGTTSDAGDFELSFSFLPLGSRRGFSAGGHVFVKLPNTNETRGVGPNTTDVTIAALLSWGAQSWRATGWAGVGILEAPVEAFEQNDVFSYAIEWSWEADERVRLALGARGRASTRGSVPLGTEDLGEVRVRGEWRVGGSRVGGTRVDVGLGRGFAGNSGDWLFEAGVSWMVARGT